MSEQGTTSAAPQRRLLRIPEGKIIGGVCTGLGAYTGLDPVIWRIGFVVLTLAGGSGILAYLVAWLVMPQAREGESVLGPQPPRAGTAGRQAPFWMGIGLLVIGTWVLLSGVFNPRIWSGMFWGILLIAVGVVLWTRGVWSGGEGSGPARPPSSPPPGTPAFGESSVGGEGSSGSGPTDPIPSSPPASAGGEDPPTTTLPPSSSPPPTPPSLRPPPPPPPPASAPGRGSRKEPSILGRLVVGAAALAIGTGVLLDNIGAIRLTLTGMLAVLVAIIGVGLVLGSVWGRARWLAIPGVFLTLALVVSSLVPFYLEGGWGEVAWQPNRVSEIESSYRHAAGQAVLDMRQVDFGSRRRDVDAQVGFGQLFVVVPDDVIVYASAQVQGGEASLFGRRISGWDVQTRLVDRAEEGRGSLYLNTRVTFGEIIVQRDSDGPLPLRGRFSGFRR